MTELLEIYLQDHHAGATATLELARRALSSNRDSDYGPELAELVRELEHDRETLERAMAMLGTKPSAVKNAGVRLGERIGRLKPNGRILSYSPLSRVVELEGIGIGVAAMLAVWETLGDAAGERLDGIEIGELRASGSAGCARAPPARRSRLRRRPEARRLSQTRYSARIRAITARPRTGPATTSAGRRASPSATERQAPRPRRGRAGYADRSARMFVRRWRYDVYRIRQTSAMTTAAPAIDFTDLAPIQAELAEVSAALAEADSLPVAAEALVRDLAISLRDMAHSDWEETVDPYLRVEIDQVTIAALLALSAEDERERLEGVELALESIRDILHDVGESGEVGDGRPAAEVSRWLRDTTQASSQELAELLGVSRRTFERWLAGASEPQGDDRMRLVLAARIVNQLRHAMTGRGAVLWFARPMPDLGGRAPRELLIDTAAAPRLVGLAAQARRSDAS